MNTHERSFWLSEDEMHLRRPLRLNASHRAILDMVAYARALACVGASCACVY